MRNFLVCSVVTLVSSVVCHPVSQPVYPNAQYVSAQSVPGIQQQAYKQQGPAVGQGYVQQPQVQLFRAQPAVHPVYENRQREGLQNYASQPFHQPVRQDVQPERQVQKLRQETGPYYFQPLQSAVLAAQARDAFAAAQRKEASVNREVQQVAGATQQQPQQYVREQPQQYLREQPQQYVREQPQQVLREQPLKFIARPVTAQYKVQQAQADEQLKQQEEDNNPNQNYQFGFDVKDDLYTNYQNRKEQRDGNKITGSYSVVDSDGYIRTVQYTADPKEGFKAEVTRQPTDIVVKVPRPDPQFQMSQQRQQLQQLQALDHLQQQQQQQELQQPQQYLQEVPVQRIRGEQKPQASNVAYRYQQ